VFAFSALSDIKTSCDGKPHSWYQAVKLVPKFTKAFLGPPEDPSFVLKVVKKKGVSFS